MSGTCSHSSIGFVAILRNVSVCPLFMCNLSRFCAKVTRPLDVVNAATPLCWIQWKNKIQNEKWIGEISVIHFHSIFCIINVHCYHMLRNIFHCSVLKTRCYSRWTTEFASSCFIVGLVIVVVVVVIRGCFHLVRNFLIWHVRSFWFTRQIQLWYI
jgi:hypothetical protein